MALLQGLDELRQRLVVVDVQELAGGQGREALEKQLGSRWLLWLCGMENPSATDGKIPTDKGRDRGGELGMIDGSDEFPKRGWMGKD